ncbi:D-glucuronyl C5-epimerase family protein [Roseinatronobacter monicus]|uniref:D-glucuronyl C5-epimerase-like protein n=1 Tax=Roseinatronobacter monicus TaxID=393481 RepID=A0A543K5M1_9RHOB|nr:D-glucuronyl C5-epimerase family protein [Roseinatronobacter monicus]TQM90344.1 D-glucuronyl C5-epimerase-like protein [Roseinatronobacter monicus]
MNYYNLCFDAQGCPMKQLGTRQVFHPILAAYLIFDLVRAYEGCGNPEALRAAEAVALQTLKRGTEFQDALVFYYSEEDGLSSVPGRFYSALTQSWFVRAFCRLSRHNPAHAQIVRLLFRSLMIPKSEGGVLVRKSFGWIVEEYPHEPTFYTLNGWLTVVRWIIESVDDLKRCDVAVGEFLDRNIDAAATMLPLYDAEFCLNSRYQLTGFTRLQVIVDREAGFQAESFAIEIPDEGYFPGSLEPQDSRWKNYLERAEGRLHQFNVVMSLISAPQPNLLHLSFTCTAPCTLRLRVAQGNYRPDSTGMPTERWNDFARIATSTPGANTIHCQIPFDAQNMFAYPTNFKKKIGDRFFNGYHFVHIIDCAEIFRFSGRTIFRDYALRFLGYQERWSELGFSDVYALTPHLDYPVGFSQFVTAMLNEKE